MSENIELTEAQVLLLNNLVYKMEIYTKFEECKKRGEPLTVKDVLGEKPKEDETKKEISNEESTAMPSENVDEIKKRISNEESTAMSSEEWEEIYALIENDEKLLNLEITSIKYDEKTGERMACFYDGNQAYVAFAGTQKNEWRDNCVAGTMEDSPQQKEALEWFESLGDELGYKDIIVSGHSKGGNKAMYVTITSEPNNVAKCYAFDGQGFSNEFCEKYKEEIAKNKDKIYLTANYRDYVNILLNKIVDEGHIKYIVNDEGVDSFAEYHAPNAILKHKDGKVIAEIGESGDQDPLFEMLGEFTVYLINNARGDEKELLLSVLGELLTQCLAKNGDVEEYIIQKYGITALKILLEYLNQFLSDTAKNNAEKYARYEIGINSSILSANDLLYTILKSYLYLIKCGSYIKNPINIIMKSIVSNFLYVEGRDFTLDTKEKMLEAAKEVEDESFWDVKKWDCWYRVEKIIGKLNWSDYIGKADEYYRKIIDINGYDQKKIKEIFENVNNEDETYANKITEKTKELEDVVSKLATIRDCFV